MATLNNQIFKQVGTAASLSQHFKHDLQSQQDISAPSLRHSPFRR